MQLTIITYECEIFFGCTKASDSPGCILSALEKSEWDYRISNYSYSVSAAVSPLLSVSVTEGEAQLLHTVPAAGRSGDESPVELRLYKITTACRYTWLSLIVCAN